MRGAPATANLGRAAQPNGSLGTGSDPTSRLVLFRQPAHVCEHSAVRFGILDTLPCSTTAIQRLTRQTAIIGLSTVSASRQLTTRPRCDTFAIRDYSPMSRDINKLFCTNGRDVILIGTELEQALAAITCCCGLSVDWAVLDRIERDCQENQVDAKEYVLHNSRRNCISATVDDYEPETISLTLTGHRCTQFDSIVDAASTPGFGQQPFFLDRPVDAPQPLVDSIQVALNADYPKRKFARFRLVAFRKLDAITRCFLVRSQIIPTPYVVCSTNTRTMETRQLVDDESKPYAIKGYR